MKELEPWPGDGEWLNCIDPACTHVECVEMQASIAALSPEQLTLVLTRIGLSPIDICSAFERARAERKAK